MAHGTWWAIGGSSHRRTGDSIPRSPTRSRERGRGLLGLMVAARANVAVTALAVVSITAASITAAAGQITRAATSDLSPPVQLTREQDHQRLMDLLHIGELRRGPDGDPTSPNAAA